MENYPYTVQQAAKLLGVGKTTLYGFLNKRKLEASKMEGKTVIFSDAIKKFLDSLPPYEPRKK
ncbi:MAG: helix-turn-helix domain-containing protein [Alphaproteobacteria bacterium]|nr:helix-turn-helix domain-containing protein [Alphaproteobacteria bacterium]